ncbi:MAG TPA: response regulator transcription factor [Streptosporangiaceae bacterium]|nr:response regulator transcription factor [Streptosporangiaceae bacterium]
MSAGETAAPVRVLIADDQKIVREGLVSLLSLLPGIDVVGAATDGDDAVRQALALRPDVVLMDLNMPRCNGVEATEQLRDRQPGTRVVVLTTYADDDWVFAALQAGARGFLTKDAGAEEIHRAIATVASGDAQLDPSVQRRLLDALASGQRLAVAGQPVPPAPAPPNPATSSPTAGSAGAAAPDAHPGELTPREAEVLRHIAAGLSNTEIAAALFVTEATVKTHINHIFTKTSLRDRAQLVRYAYQHGLVRPG